MPDFANLQIRVERTGVDQATASLDKLEKEAGQTERQVESLGRSFTAMGASARSGLAGILGALGAGLGIAELARTADEMTNIDSKLRLVTSSAEEFNMVYERLFDISNKSRSAITSSVDTYSRFAQATKDAGVSTAELLQITETLNKSFIISGATTQESSAALRQLGQAMSSGVLRGDEFNSVSEQGSRVIQALVDHLDKGRGKLRSLAEQGKLTSDVLKNALLTQTEKVNEEFELMARTIGQSTTIGINNLKKLVGVFDNVPGASDSVGGAIISLSENIDKVAAVAAIAAAGIASRLAASMIVAATATAKSSVESIKFAAAEQKKRVALIASSQAALQESIAMEKSAVSTLRAARASLAANGAMAAATGQRAKLTAAVLAAEVAHNKATLAVNTNTAAVARNSAAASRGATATRGFSSVLAALGGPAGVAMLAGSAIAAMALRTDAAADAVTGFKVRLAELRGETGKLQLLRLQEEFRGVSKEVAALEAQIKGYAIANKLARSEAVKAFNSEKIEEVNSSLSVAKELQAQINKEIEKTKSLIASPIEIIKGGTTEKANQELKKYEERLLASAASAALAGDKIKILNSLFSEGRIGAELYKNEIASLTPKLGEAASIIKSFSDNLKDLALNESLAGQKFEMLRAAFDSGKISAAAYNEEVRSLGAGFSSMIDQGEVATQQLMAFSESLDAAEMSMGLAGQKHDILLEKLRSGAIGTEVYQEKLGALGGKYSEIANGIEQWSGKMADAMAGSMSKGKFAFKDMITSMLADLARAQAKKMFSQLFTSLLGNVFGSFGGTDLGLSSGILEAGTASAPPQLMPVAARASGGPVSAGQPYLVGERGPELLVPRASGTVIPNGKTMGSTTNVSISINVDASGGTAVSGDAGQGRQLGQSLVNVVKRQLVIEQRSGGLLAQRG